MTSTLVCCHREDAPPAFADSDNSIIRVDPLSLTFMDELRQLVGKKSKILVDCSNIESIDQLEYLLEDTSMVADRIYWMGHADLLSQIRDQFPSAKVWLIWNHFEMPTSDDVSGLAPEFLYLDYSFINSENLTKVHEMSMKVATSPIDDLATMRWAIAIGIDSISTRCAEVLKGAIAASPMMDHSSPQKTDLTEIEVERAMTVARVLGKWAISVASTMEPGVIKFKKSAADIVTQIDVLIEVHVREVIAANFSGHNFVGEEMGGEFLANVPTWYLDPIDGTTNFANHLPWTSFSLALAHNRTPLLGVVIDPWRNSLLEAQAGKGAFHNGAQIFVEDQLDIDHPLRSRIVATELDAYIAWPGMLELLDGLASKYCTARIMGSGTLTMAGVAMRRGVGAVVGRFSAIDHLASLLIVNEAGGIVWDETGKENLFPASGGVMTATKAAAQPLYDLWMKAIGSSQIGNT